MIILVLNSGSSSLKFQILHMPAERVLASGRVERIGESSGNALLFFSPATGDGIQREFACPDHQNALEALFQVIPNREVGCLASIEEIEAVGHRVVHGRDLFSSPCFVTTESLARMDSLVELAPLHMPANLTCIRACMEMLPGAPQVAHFDTGFFQSMPDHAHLYPVPISWHKEHGIRRYGFHGISHEFVTLAASEKLGIPLEELRLITAHLGNGASMTAYGEGRVQDTSMGFTPFEGLMMGTRAGFVDPAVISHLTARTGAPAEELIAILNNESGLKGVSGVGRDMRNILRERARGNGRADLAFRMFIHVLRRYAGAYDYLLGGAHAFVFTGGIGENSPEVREALFHDLAPLGIGIDAEKNQGAVRGKTARISTRESRVAVWVIPTNEERLIARRTYSKITNLPSSS